MTPAATAALLDLPPLETGTESGNLVLLLGRARDSADGRAAAEAMAATLVDSLRRRQARQWVEPFLREYGLQSAEGLRLMGLAEASLRVPDRLTRRSLCRDRIAGGNWRAHAGASPAWPVNLATRALQLCDLLLRVRAPLAEALTEGGVALAMRWLAGHFVFAPDIARALHQARRPRNVAYAWSFDMLGEAAMTRAAAERYEQAYAGAIAAVAASGASHGVSVKLSALCARYEPWQRASAVPEVASRLLGLARAAAAGGVALTIDAEEHDRLELSRAVLARVAAEPALAGWEGLGLAVQAYDLAAPAMLRWAGELAASTRRRLHVRLVKGAYWDTEIKRAQQQGLARYPVYTRKAATDVAFLACARQLLATPQLCPAFATHNALTVATLLPWVGERRDCEFQRLHGMGQGLYDPLVRAGRARCRVYAPVGAHDELLAYLVRRLLENGANSSFVNQLAGDAAASAELLADPVAALAAVQCSPNPEIPLPINIYGASRRNSAGIDPADREAMGRLLQHMASAWSQPQAAAPIINGAELAGAARVVADPAGGARAVGTVVEAGAGEVQAAMAVALAAQPAWAAEPATARAACLERTADLLEAECANLAALAVREAGKTVADAIAEVREAVDFCRYYAAEARRLFQPVELPGPTGEHNELRLEGRGVFACISPWNFPLAIFVGQVAAALVAGNAVLAKPAPQTPLLAAAAVRLLLRAGIPPGTLALLPGGAETGAAILREPRLAGVAFTGSSATARQIAGALLAGERPLLPLIAETGGINAMLVDSSALPEQVVRDVLRSAFYSAGQRCSALRLLCLQEDIAAVVLPLLTGAMQALRIGDPAQLDTDVGPVIDAAARDRIESHVREHQAQLLFRCPPPADLPAGHFVMPALIRLPDIEALRREVFGPVLHVVTWRAGELAETVARINALGYGLTMGVHSRIAAHIDCVRRLARVGNLYVNRAMTGAVVGSQPFGGEGHSGTGPKAGGPHYLLRFVTERTVSTDTTAAGGNVALLRLG